MFTAELKVSSCRSAKARIECGRDARQGALCRHLRYGHDDPRDISLLEHNAVDVKSVVTDRLPLKDIEEGLRRMHDPDHSLKILFNL